jgi:hypothetical protein
MSLFLAYSLPGRNDGAHSSGGWGVRAKIAGRKRVFAPGRSICPAA